MTQKWLPQTNISLLPLFCFFFLELPLKKQKNIVGVWLGNAFHLKLDNNPGHFFSASKDIPSLNLSITPPYTPLPIFVNVSESWNESK